MKKINYLLVFLFMMSVALQAQTKKQEKHFKKAVSIFVKKVKKIDDRNKKEKVLENFVTKLNAQYEKMDIASLTEIEKQLLQTTFENMNKGFTNVRGQSNLDLNAYADYIESEFNQADAGVLLVVILIVALSFAVALV